MIVYKEWRRIKRSFLPGASERWKCSGWFLFGFIPIYLKLVWKIICFFKGHKWWVRSVENGVIVYGICDRCCCVVENENKGVTSGKERN